MKKVRRSVFSTKNLLTVILVALVSVISAQNVAINDAGLPPDSSAMLDISSQDKGLLIPRLRSTQRLSIVNPANGLLVFQIDPPRGFYSYFSTPGVWTRITMDSTLTLDHVLAVGNNGANQSIVGLSSLSVGSNNTNFAKIKVVDAFPNLRLTSGGFTGPSNLANSGVLEFMENDMDFLAGGYGFQMRYIASTNDRLQIRSAANGIIDTMLSIRRGLGYMGIREDNPQAQLHIRSAIRSVLRLEREGSLESYMHFANDNYDLISGLDAGGNYGIFNSVNPFGSKFVISNNGNVGISQSNPAARLHLFSNSRMAQLNESNSVTGTWFVMGNSSTGGQYHHLISSGSNNGEGAGKLLFGYGPSPITVSDIAMTIDNSNVGINVDTPATAFHVNHPTGFTNGFSLTNNFDPLDRWHFYVYTTDNLTLHFNNAARGSFDALSGLYSALSDQRFKKNISNAESVLEKLNRLQVKEYHFLGQDESEPKSIGIIAQELKNEFPALVTVNNETGEESTESVHMVNYSGMGVIAIKAIQEQQEKIDNLERRIKELEDLIHKIQQEE